MFDSLSELRLVAGNPLRYRRQILAFKQFFAGRNCTVLLLDDMTAADQDLHVQSIAHGVILLQNLSPEYGAERRRLRVVKYRGSEFRGGYHDYLINKGGLEVFPRLVAAEHRRVNKTGEAAVQHRGARCAAGRRHRGGHQHADRRRRRHRQVDHRGAVLLRGGRRAGRRRSCSSSTKARTRCSAAAPAWACELEEHNESGAVRIVQIDPAELSPGEFTHQIRKAVEDWGASVVVIDSLNGYLNAMPEERFLTIQLHELLMYLSQKGVATHPDRRAPGRDRVADADAG